MKVPSAPHGNGSEVYGKCFCTIEQQDMPIQSRPRFALESRWRQNWRERNFLPRQQDRFGASRDHQLLVGSRCSSQTRETTYARIATTLNACWPCPRDRQEEASPQVPQVRSRTGPRRKNWKTSRPESISVEQNNLVDDGTDCFCRKSMTTSEIHWIDGPQPT